ncbi:MAG TPA: hypothetical protein VGJ13_05235 [Pseudonocardiaceae bacterium]
MAKPATKPAAKPVAAKDPNSPDNAIYPVKDNPSASKPPLCPEDFPGGWPADAGHVVGCTHGMWIRELPEEAT